MTYTLSIEDKTENGIDVIERTVIVEGIYNSFKAAVSYNPNAATKPLVYEGPFDTAFSIVHPFREIIGQIVQNHFTRPQIKYDSSVNDAQKTLFENILTQKFEKVRIEKIRRSAYPFLIV